MTRTSLLFCISILLLTSSPLLAGKVPGEEEAESPPSSLYNPREEFLFGIGTILGGAAGGMGIQADYHFLPRLGVQGGVGSGYYFGSLFLSGRYYFFPSKFSPYAAAGFALWKPYEDTQKNLSHLFDFKKLGIVEENGAMSLNSVRLLPLSVGVQYLSLSGLAGFVEFSYILSLTTIKGIPYGGIGLQWFF
ncbi:MAG TPA: hypothetical protein VJL87_04590 [Bdellovibrionota bacterium]|nr:hypothetical protein [Bdellovibrionota bacterium]